VGTGEGELVLVVLKLNCFELELCSEFLEWPVMSLIWLRVCLFWFVSVEIL